MEEFTYLLDNLLHRISGDNLQVKFHFNAGFQSMADFLEEFATSLSMGWRAASKLFWKTVFEYKCFGNRRLVHFYACFDVKFLEKFRKSAPMKFGRPVPKS